MTAVVGAAHEAGVERLLDSYRAIPAGERVRLAKRTSNLFRPRAASTTPGLDTTGLTGVVAVGVDAPPAPQPGPALPTPRSGKNRPPRHKPGAPTREVGDGTTLADSSVMNLISQGLSKDSSD